MNKIITSIKEKIVIDENGTITIDIKDTKEKVLIQVKENIQAKIVVLAANTKNEIVYTIGRNAQLTVDKLVVDGSDHVYAHLFQNSSFFYNYSTINYKQNCYKIEVFHEEKNATSKVVNHGVNVENENLDFLVEGTILKNSTDSICIQDNKIICMKENHAGIKPNLMIDNDKIEAEHSAYIGKLDEEELFYIMSRGVERKEANKLLLKAFLLGDIETEENKFINIIDSIGGE